ncbi:WhiB family transcriptional regulator [Rhodococcus fascians]|nr:WhiB family transcriptional regulator [Rhodococcus fascians]MBY4238652.1 WhiB family transcriptional regulator [Rhodococcus fascians]MBY4254759.1 WhiB family transcriptional regulator [Rhodococcus fascians]MBY4270007.1 WhiB family transcriptional regulator [Rhodococcus fascians]
MSRVQSSSWRLRLPSPGPETEWQKFAHCNTYDTDLFFEPEVEGRTARVHREQVAKRICSECRVLMRCRAEALYTAESHGVWGGLSATERKRAGALHRSDTPAQPL